VKVKLLVGMSGTRNGEDWPPQGAEMEVSDSEGAQLCAGGLAEPVAEPEKVEKAVAPKAETRKASK